MWRVPEGGLARGACGLVAGSAGQSGVLEPWGCDCGCSPPGFLGTYPPITTRALITCEPIKKVISVYYCYELAIQKKCQVWKCTLLWVTTMCYESGLFRSYYSKFKKHWLQQLFIQEAPSQKGLIFHFLWAFWTEPGNIAKNLCFVTLIRNIALSFFRSKE